MNGELLVALAQNAAVLWALLILVHLASAGGEGESRLRQAGLGAMIGAAAIALVLTGYQTPAGMLYDTRTVLLALAGLLFSPLATAIAAAVAIAHRIQVAGPVVGAGIMALLVAGGLGMAARSVLPRPLTNLSWLHLYALGMLIHALILLIPPLLSLQPDATGLPVETLPVLLFYPPVLACGGKLILWLRELEATGKRVANQDHQLELLADLGRAGLGDHDLRSHRLTLSPQMARQFRLDSSQRNVPVETLMEQAHTLDRERLEQEIQLMVERATPARPAELSVDYRLKRGENEWEWMRCLSRVVDWDREGRPTRILMAQTSIDEQRRLQESRRKLQREADSMMTEASQSRLALLSVLEDRKKTEQALRESQRLLDEMSHLARIIGWEKDLTTNEKRFTPGIYRMAEQPGSSEITFQQGDALMHPEDRVRIAQAVRECLADKHKSIDQELRFVHPDGAISWAHSVGAVVWENDRPIRLRGSLQDITPIKEAEAERRKSYDMLVKMAAQVPGAIFQYQRSPDSDGFFPWASEGMRQILELEPEAVREDAGAAFSRVHPDDLARLRQGIAESERTLEPLRIECRVVLPEQGLQWRRCDSVPERQEDGSTLWHGIFTDITERKAVEERLQLSSLVYEHSSEAMMITDPRGGLLDINDAFTRITGYDRVQILGHSAWDLYEDTESPAFFKAVQRRLLKTGHWHGELRSRRRNGETFYQRLTINAAYDEAGQIHHWVGHFSDITEQKRAERVIWEQAHFDPLTQLPNRRMFHDRLARDIGHARRQGQSLALLFMDLDHFKEVNDTLGHESGDQILREATTRIQSCVREMDTVCRLGGDEFIIILGNLESAASAERISRRLLESFHDPFTVGSETLYMSASIGITLFPEDAGDIETLMKNADQAMYAAKREGRNRFRYFTPQMQQAAQQRMSMIRELRTAYREDQLQVHYQPIVHLASGRVRKLEALLRWDHPDRGIICPGDFITVAEETGLIVPIGDDVFHQVTAQLQDWRRQGFEDLQVSLNLSPAQLNTREELVREHWEPRMQALDLPGATLVLEITEGVLLDTRPRIREELLACRNAGVQIALDDFGTGYSSLAYLKQFDIDYLKIDRSFIHQIEPDNQDLALCQAMVVMAHKLGIEVVAEGVETRQQLSLLRDLGCDYVQGFLLARPMTAEKAGTLIGEFRL